MIRRLLVIAGLLAVSPLHIADAQQANPSAAAVALGAYSARAVGYEAVAWNPARLAAPHRPKVSFSIGALDLTSGVAPLTPQVMADWAGVRVPAVVAGTWVNQVREAGGEFGQVELGFTPLALSLGNVGFQYSVAGFGEAALSPDAVDLMLRGNVDRTTGQAGTFSLAGSSLEAGLVSTAAVSVAKSLPPRLLGAHAEHLSVGVTGKYVLGHAYAVMQDNGSTITPDGVALLLPIVHSDPDASLTPGSGVAFDVGLSAELGKWSASATMRNLVSTFAWNEANFRYRPGVGVFNAQATSFGFDTMPYSAAPAELTTRVQGAGLRPQFAAGVAREGLLGLNWSADLQVTSGEGLTFGPEQFLGVGAELERIPLLPLRIPVRAGIAKVDRGWQTSAGVGLALGAYELSVSAVRRIREGRQETGISLGILDIR